MTREQATELIELLEKRGIYLCYTRTEWRGGIASSPEEIGVPIPAGAAVDIIVRATER